MRTPPNISLLDVAKSLGTGVLPEAGGGGSGLTAVADSAVPISIRSDRPSNSSGWMTDGSGNYIPYWQVLAQDALVSAWESAVVAAGGTMGSTAEAILNTLMGQLRGKTYFGKLVYFLPLCGVGINAARIPLIDTLSKGACSNIGMVDADFSQARGLIGDGSSKRLDLPLRSSDVIAFTAGSFGMGVWDLQLAGNTPNMPFTSYLESNNLCGGILLYPGVELFASRGVNGQDSFREAYLYETVTAGDFYGQDQGGTNISFYKNGSALSTSYGITGAVGVNELAIGLCGCANNGAGWWSADTLGAALVTTGTLTPTEIADLHATMHTYLLLATGKVSS
jgi:hypothetical protein